MGLDVFENYECDGQIEISNLKGERMDKLIYIPADQIHEHPDNPRKDLGDLRGTEHHGGRTALYAEKNQ